MPKKDIYKQADEPVRKTENGRYGEDSEMSPHEAAVTSQEKPSAVHAVDDEQRAAFSYFAPSKLRNRKIDKMIEEDGG